MIELVVIGATLALAAGASGAQLHRRYAAARVFASYATSRRHVFVPAPSESPRASPRVEGVHEGVRFVIDLYKLRDMVRTRVSANVAHGMAPRFDVVRGGVHGATPDDADTVRHHAGAALQAFAPAAVSSFRVTERASSSRGTASKRIRCFSTRRARRSLRSRRCMRRAVVHIGDTLAGKFSQARCPFSCR